MTDGLALARVTDDADALRIDAQGLPLELQRRLLLHAFVRFHAPEPRGAELTRALAALPLCEPLSARAKCGDCITALCLSALGHDVRAPGGARGPIASKQTSRPAEIVLYPTNCLYKLSNIGLKYQ